MYFKAKRAVARSVALMPHKWTRVRTFLSSRVALRACAGTYAAIISASGLVRLLYVQSGIHCRCSVPGEFPRFAFGRSLFSGIFSIFFTFGEASFLTVFTVISSLLNLPLYFTLELANNYRLVERITANPLGWRAIRVETVS